MTCERWEAERRLIVLCFMVCSNAPTASQLVLGKALATPDADQG